MKFFPLFILLNTCIMFFFNSPNIDFGKSKTNANWVVVNDGVMGGLSEGSIEYTKKSLVFSGDLSLRNNGGFSWLKSPSEERKLSKYKGIKVRLKGDGRSYAFTIQTGNDYSGIYYRQEFDTTEGEWMELQLPFSRFTYTMFAQMTNEPLQNTADIRILGIILGDKKEGPFRMEIDYLKFY